MIAQGYPSTCIDSHNVPTVYTRNRPVKHVWLDSRQRLLPSELTLGLGRLQPVSCFPIAPALRNRRLPGACAAFGGEFYPDGKPDTYKDPKREYEAVELEVNKSFSHNWAMVANWRIAQLRGNYEGAFRNDNGQADPGISSLFDLTEGAFRSDRATAGYRSTKHGSQAMLSTSTRPMF